MVLNIAAYRFVRIDEPCALARRLESAARDASLKGTILVAPEGINLFLAGTAVGIDRFLLSLRADPRFESLAEKRSWSRAVPFARLKVKAKREIIPFRREGASPLDAPAPAVAPRELARWIANGRSDDGRPLLLLDIRNREEVAHGTFAGALTLPIDDFADLPGALAPHRDALAGHAVVAFCTGGVRCERTLPWLRAQGMDGLLQLEGGILGYFEQVGGTGFEGRCFVFDQRVALDPSMRPLVDGPVAGAAA